MTHNCGRQFSSTYEYLYFNTYKHVARLLRHATVGGNSQVRTNIFTSIHINMSHAYYDTQLWEAILKYVRISLLQYI